MRFYLDLPLAAGYVLMATSACLGMLQVVAARGGYRGLSLFSTDQKLGVRIGAGLTVISVVVYVLFAPDIFTPGPAGSEVAAMFAVCALVALGLTLVGADLRLRRTEIRFNGDGEWLPAKSVSAMLYRSSPTLSNPLAAEMAQVPAVIMIPDPSGFFVTPGSIVEGLCDAGLAVLVLDTQRLAQSKTPPVRQTLLDHVSAAITELGTQNNIDKNRIGLLGVGWGADLTLQAASNNGRIKEAMAVCPIALAPLKPGMTAPGLDWLRDLSYRQVWRWRRRGPALIYGTQEMALEQDWRLPAPIERETGKNYRIMTTRNTSPVAEPLPVLSRKYFALLDDESTRRLIVQWFQDRLLTDT
jgi:hypothetical protein